MDRTPNGQFAKGHKRFFTKETNEKLSKNSPRIWLGKKFSEEHKRKIKEARKHQVFTDEHKQAMSKARMGHPSYTKGLKHSDETKRKMSLSRKKEKHWNWKGGITSLVMQIRHCFQYRQWRSDIFTRDDYTCVLCGQKGGGDLNADHYPKSFSDIFHTNKIKTLEQAISCDEFWNINNGRTLCVPCHKLTDNYSKKNVLK